MNDYKRQFFYEGIGNILYNKPKKIIDSNIKNKSLNIFLNIVLKVLYTIIAFICAILLFYVTFPFH